MVNSAQINTKEKPTYRGEGQHGGLHNYGNPGNREIDVDSEVMTKHTRQVWQWSSSVDIARQFCMAKQVHNLHEVRDSEQETEKDSDEEEGEEDPFLFICMIESSCVTEDKQFLKSLK